MGRFKTTLKLGKHGADLEDIRNFEWETAVFQPSPRRGEIR